MAARPGFDEFVAARSARLVRLAHLITGDRERAEVVVRDALVRTWREWPSLDTDPELHARSTVVARCLPLLPLADHTSPPDPPSGADLWHRFQQLDAHARALVALHLVEGLPAAQVAALLHRPTRSVEAHAEEALARLGTDRLTLTRLLQARTGDVDVVDLVALHQRIDAVRRRRGRGVVAAGVAVAVALGLALMPAVLAGDDEADPPPRSLAGHDVPRTLVSSGFTYEYTEGFESVAKERELVVSLPATDEPRLVAWASSVPTIGAYVTATVDGRRRAREAAGSLEAFELLPEGTEHEVVLTQAGVGLTDHLAVAVYSLTDEPPPGVSNGRTTFRERILGERLQAGVLGAPGEDQADVRVEVPEVGARVALTCSGAEGLEARVALGPTDLGSAPCTRRPERDAGAGGTAWHGVEWHSLLEDAGLAPGDTTTLRAWLAPPDGSAGEPDEELVLGAGLYSDLVPRTRVAGVDVPVRVEVAGHEWRLDGDGYVGPRGRARTTYAAGPGEPHRLYGVVVSGGRGPRSPLTWDVLVGSLVVETVREEGGRAGLTLSPYLVVPQGDHRMLEVEVTQGATDRTRAGFVGFRRVDPLP